jgi:hypothetical protein
VRAIAHGLKQAIHDRLAKSVSIGTGLLAVQALSGFDKTHALMNDNLVSAVHGPVFNGATLIECMLLRVQFIASLIISVITNHLATSC